MQWPFLRNAGPEPATYGAYTANGSAEEKTTEPERKQAGFFNPPISRGFDCAPSRPDPYVLDQLSHVVPAHGDDLVDDHFDALRHDA